MSRTLTQIPELNYDDLVAEARARLPALCPEWTDHGPADVGVTLIELLAHVAEMIHYRTRRETDAITRAFVELLAGREASREPDLTAALRRALADTFTPFRAVTEADYEDLARDVWPHSPEAAALADAARLRRVRCLADRDVEAQGPLAPAPGHVSLVVLPRDASVASPVLCDSLYRFFDPRRLLTTRLHVVGPRYLTVRVDAQIYLDDDVAPKTVRARVEAELARWLDPHAGGVDGDGWPIGGDVFVSDLYGRIDGVPGVDFVADLAVRTDATGRALTGRDGAPVGLRLHPHELVALDLAGSQLRLFEPTGDSWEEAAR